MLTKIRIEVEEPTPEMAVLALTKYEHALQTAEANRFGLEYVDPEGAAAIRWSDGLVERDFYNERLGRELVEEIIEFDQSIPAYKGRRVVRFIRLDTRSAQVHSMESGWVPPKATEVVG